MQCPEPGQTPVSVATHTSWRLTGQIQNLNSLSEGFPTYKNADHPHLVSLTSSVWELLDCQWRLSIQKRSDGVPLYPQHGMGEGEACHFLMMPEHHKTEAPCLKWAITGPSPTAPQMWISVQTCLLSCYQMFSKASPQCVLTSLSFLEHSSCAWSCSIERSFHQGSALVGIREDWRFLPTYEGSIKCQCLQTL